LPLEIYQWRNSNVVDSITLEILSLSAKTTK
jgi:hypothetical protein